LRTCGHARVDRIGVVLEDVDLSVLGPGSRGTQRPERRPETGRGGEPGAHLETTVLEALLPLRVNRARSVLGELARRLPAGRAGIVARIGHLLPAGLDDQQAIFLPDVICLVPLMF